MDAITIVIGSTQSLTFSKVTSGLLRKVRVSQFIGTSSDNHGGLIPVLCHKLSFVLFVRSFNMIKFALLQPGAGQDFHNRGCSKDCACSEHHEPAGPYTSAGSKARWP